MGEVAWLSVIVLGFAIVGSIWARAIRRERGRCPKGKGLYPECLHVVALTDDQIEVSHPDGTRDRVPLHDLTKVVVETNDSGPLGADVWWRWYGGPKTMCSYPQGATGEDGALAFVQTLDAFNDDALRSAMGCASNRTFVVYERLM